MTALTANFKGYEMIRQLCVNAPKYGNNDLYADSIGREVEDFIKSFAHNYTNLHGGKLSVVYVPITKHVPFGRAVGALPNGRKAGDALSDGISPSQGADTQGPTATLMSLANTTESKFVEVESRLFNMKLSPQSVAGDLGTRKLASLIRTWCDLKLWHMQFNIVNSQTLIAAQKNPEKYRNLLVRVAGYSAYFVDLSKDLQNEIIARAEKTF
jgi:formate C-acetyltransferase